MARGLDLVPRRVAGRHVTSPAFGSYRCVSWVDLKVASFLQDTQPWRGTLTSACLRLRQDTHVTRLIGTRGR